MSILIQQKTRVLVQGITGKQGTSHAEQMLAYGTRIVGGVSPGKGGGKHLALPLFNTMYEAVRETGAEASIIFVPAPFAADAIMEAADAGVKLVICVTEGIPLQDMMQVMTFLDGRQTRLIGPNCPGIISPGACKLGIMPSSIHQPGRIGVLSRSGTLAYEAVSQLTKHGLGQSTCIGLGGDPILGMRFTDGLRLFKEDKETDAVVLIGEIGGEDEEDAARYIEAHFTKPVVAYIAGQTAPPGKRMGHAGAWIHKGKGDALSKKALLKNAGVTVVDSPADIGDTVKRLMVSE